MVLSEGERGEDERVCKPNHSSTPTTVGYTITCSYVLKLLSQYFLNYYIENALDYPEFDCNIFANKLIVYRNIL
jgi:hypothetical protein